MADSPEEAQYFLEQTEVMQPLYYVMIRTPKGEWGRDKDGIFLSQLSDFQRDLSLRQCVYNWDDGVGYRTKTIVQCPDCNTYNLADSNHIRFNDM